MRIIEVSRVKIVFPQPAREALTQPLSNRTRHSLSRAVTIVVHILNLSRPFSFDSSKSPMLKSAELLGFLSLLCSLYLGTNV